MRWFILVVLASWVPAAVVQLDVTVVLTDDIIVNASGNGIDTSQVPVTGMEAGSCLLTQAAARQLAPETGNGLPDDGRFEKRKHHPAIQLHYRNSDDGPNARRLGWKGDSVDLELPPDRYTEIHLVMLGASGGFEMAVTFIYEDGRTEMTDPRTVPDWCDDRDDGPELYHLSNGMDTVRSDGRSGYRDRNDASLFGMCFRPEPGRALTGIRVTRVDDNPGMGAFLGAVGVLPGVARTTAPKAKRTPCPGGLPVPATAAERLQVDRQFEQLTATHLEHAMAAARAMMGAPGPYATWRALEAIQIKRQGPMNEVKRILAEQLAGRLGEEDPAVRAVVWDEFLETMGRERSTEIQEPLVRAAATYPEAQVAQDELLRFYPRSKNDEVRVAIIGLVGELGQPGATGFLQRCARSRFATPRLTAVTALFNHDETIARNLTRHMALEDDYSQNRIAAVQKLATYGKEELDTLCKVALQDGSWYVRRTAYQGLQRKRDARIVSTLCAGLREDPKEDIRMMIPPMMSALSDPAWNARMLDVLRRRADREGNRDVLARIRTAIEELR